MSDPNMDAADAHMDWQAAMWEEMMREMDAATEDAKRFGFGYLRITWPGPQYKHIPLSQVRPTPKESGGDNG